MLIILVDLIYLELESTQLVPKKPQDQPQPSNKFYISKVYVKLSLRMSSK